MGSGPGGREPGTGRGWLGRLGRRKAARAGPECVIACVEQPRGPGAKTDSAPELRWGTELSWSYERGDWSWVLAQAAQGRPCVKDAGSLRGAQAVGAGSSASVGEEMGCRDVSRLWSEALGEVLGVGDAVYECRKAAAAMGEETICGDCHGSERGFGDTWDCRLY